MTKNMTLFVGLTAILIVGLLSSGRLTAEEVTVVGTINDDYQIV